MPLEALETDAMPSVVDVEADGIADTPFRRQGQKRVFAKSASLEWALKPAGWPVKHLAVGDRSAAARKRRGSLSHKAGLAAEAAVERCYATKGAAILARRWRCAEGEIDLIARDGDVLVFIEVKRRVRAIEDDPVGERQWRRLEAAAKQYMVIAETGDAPLRFDLAIVGADGTITVVDNARC